MESKQKVPILKDEVLDNTKIPSAIFIESVEDFCKQYGLESVIEEVTAAYNKFKFTESQFLKYRDSMSAKIPEIEKAITLINHLKSQKDIEDEIRTKFLLTEAIYTEAVCTDRDVVYLWLGANTMVEYKYDEALALLTKNFENAKKNIDTYNNDLENIRDQITMMEVNMARLHNYKVKVNQQSQKA